jgi:tetratricopeptide (TPR) repeat protein
MSRLYIVFLLLIGSAAAQYDTGTSIGRLRVRIAFTDGACDFSTHVTLIGQSGPVAQGTANDQCVVDFMHVPAGTYHLSVSGRNGPYTDSGNIIVDSNGSEELEVRVKRASESGTTGGMTSGAFVSASDLGVPAKARKEFDKANELIDKQDFSQAIQRLNKAIAIYPGYVGAYNNLGVIYARLGDRNKERDVLQKAVSIDEHYAPAYMNLGRMDISTGDFQGAETALNKAASADPTDAMTLVLLSYAEFMNHRFDEAIATSKLAHMQKGTHAFAHQVAARAFAQKRDGASAIAELEMFLKEEPTGPRAEIARTELANLRAIVH